MRVLIRLRRERPEFRPAYDALLMGSLSDFCRKVYAWTGLEYAVDVKTVANCMGVSEDAAYKALHRLHIVGVVEREYLFNNDRRRFVYKRTAA